MPSPTTASASDPIRSQEPQHQQQHQHNNPANSTRTVIPILTVVVAIIIAFFLRSASTSTSTSTPSSSSPVSPANLFGLNRLFGIRTAQTSAAAAASRAGRTTAPGPVFNQKKKVETGQVQTEIVNMRTPVYFLSHGGPSVMYDQDHPAYSKLASIGREITTKVKPKAVVVFSAHWQAGRDVIQVNQAEMTELIYDFYGFPDHYYKEKYPNVGSRSVAGRVLELLRQGGIKAEGVTRGLDHGVWASFKCAFDPSSNPLNVPIVQVSLFGTEDPTQHYRLGQAVSALRDENILIIVSGMAVHNLRDMFFTRGDPTPLPYTASFDEALKEAVTSAPAEREAAMAALLKRGDARQAHPFFDHLLPIYIGAGAAGEDLGRRLWTFPEGSMSWAQYRFGGLNGSAGGSSL